MLSEANMHINKIQNHVPVETFKVVGEFTSKGINFKAELVSNFISYNDAKSFLSRLKTAELEFIRNKSEICFTRS